MPTGCPEPHCCWSAGQCHRDRNSGPFLWPRDSLSWCPCANRSLPHPTARHGDKQWWLPAFGPALSQGQVFCPSCPPSSIWSVSKAPALHQHGAGAQQGVLLPPRAVSSCHLGAPLGVPYAGNSPGSRMAPGTSVQHGLVLGSLCTSSLAPRPGHLGPRHSCDGSKCRFPRLWPHSSLCPLVLQWHAGASLYWLMKADSAAFRNSATS